MRVLMAKGTTGSFESLTGSIALADAIHALERQRVDIDRRLMTLSPREPVAHELWQDLEMVGEQLHAAVRALAKAPAADLANLRAKAAVLAILLWSQVTDAGQLVAETERIALALSVTDDIAYLTNG
jgi:hypothetical protein